jgi:hypothetical protein
MIRQMLLVALLLSTANLAFGQPEESQIYCTVQAECGNAPGIPIVTPRGSMGYSCAQSYYDLQQLLKADVDAQYPSPEEPCTNGATVLYRLVECVPYNPNAIVRSAGELTTTSNFRVLLDYKFSTGETHGTQGTGSTCQAAFSNAMNSLCELADSNLFGQVCAGTGHCYFSTPWDTTLRKCCAPRCPTKQTSPQCSAHCVVSSNIQVSPCQPIFCVPAHCCQPIPSRLHLTNVSCKVQQECYLYPGIPTNAPTNPMTCMGSNCAQGFRDCISQFPAGNCDGDVVYRLIECKAMTIVRNTPKYTVLLDYQTTIDGKDVRCGTMGMDDFYPVAYFQAAALFLELGVVPQPGTGRCHYLQLGNSTPQSCSAPLFLAGTAFGQQVSADSSVSSCVAESFCQPNYCAPAHCRQPIPLRRRLFYRR